MNELHLKGAFDGIQRHRRHPETHDGRSAPVAAASVGGVSHWLVFLSDEAPDGKVRELSKGWLRASHRKLDPARSTPAVPYHPHSAAEPLTPGEVYAFAIELWPTCNVFKPGHRMRLEIANSDSISATSGRPHVTLRNRVTNTIYEGGPKASRLVVPVIPR